MYFMMMFCWKMARSEDCAPLQARQLLMVMLVTLTMTSVMAQVEVYSSEVQGTVRSSPTVTDLRQRDPARNHLSIIGERCQHSECPAAPSTLFLNQSDFID